MMYLNGVGNGDSDDLYWYNNAIAEGAHAYPHGIHKYYDVFSFRGYVRYLIDYWTVYVIEMVGRITIIPVDIIHSWFTRDNSNWSTPFLIWGIEWLFIWPINNPFLFPIIDQIFALMQIEVERGFKYDY